MKLVCAGSKQSPTYYIQKSVRVNGKSTTKTIERLGSIDEIKARCGNVDPILWAKNYACELTKKEKEDRKDVIIKYSPSTLIESNIRNSCNIGYLFLKNLYYQLGLNNICKHISDKYKHEYDLNEILMMLVFSRIIAPSSKRDSLKEAKNFLEEPKCDLHQVYRSLEVLANENDYLLSEIYNNSKKVVKRNTSVLYYDCTNYYFEIEESDDFRKFGFSKEHRPNPIVQMGLFIDSNGLPLTFSMFEGNQSKQLSLKPLERKIIEDFETSEFVVCTDAGLSSMANRRFNDIEGRKFVTTQPIKKLKGFLKEFCLSNNGWSKKGSNKKYNLNEIDIEEEYNTVFYKSRWINEDNLEQKLIVSYSPRYAYYQKKLREKHLERALKNINNPTSLNKTNKNDPKRFINTIHQTIDGEIAKISKSYIDNTKIDNEAMYDGFYAVCTNLEVDETKIIEINQKRWQIEESFRIMKNEFKARPVYLSKKDRILAHFTTCFIALLVYRILELKLNSKYSCEAIIKTLKDMNMFISLGDGYIPSYTRTELTDALNAIFGFRTDYQIITQKNMRNILNKIKK